MDNGSAIADCEVQFADSGDSAIRSSRSTIGIVVIGRNEGERLRRCFTALGDRLRDVVYVDSGSTDGSADLARSFGIDVVELDGNRPFTAARARNAGFERLVAIHPGVEFMQFVDGDCELDPSWLAAAERVLRDDPKVDAVFGRLRERHPETSVYNRLCEVEWNLAAAGDVPACGGNVLMRAAAFRAAGGFDGNLPAGEEGELCLRLRRAGGTIRRLDADMGSHDAAMTSWQQWWRRAERFGFAAADCAARHGRSSDRFHVRDVVKTVVTGGLLPLAILTLIGPTGGWSLLALVYYPFTALRVMNHVRSRGVPTKTALAFGTAVAVAKFPQFVGICRYCIRRPSANPHAGIAYLAPYYPHGSHTFIRREIAALEAAGVPIERFSLRPPHDLVDPADVRESAKTTVLLAAGAWRMAIAMLLCAARHPLRFCRALALAVRCGRRSDRGVARHLIYLGESCWLRRDLARRQSRHLHAHFGTNATTIAMLVRTLGGPSYSFTVHGPEEFDDPRGLALDWKIDRANFVVAISSFGRSQLCRWCNEERSHKIHVVHCGVDASFLHAEVEPIPNQPRLVCVGRLCEQKGQLLLIEAAAELAKAGVPFELVLAGDGPLRPAIETAIDRCGLANRVRITGWLSAEQVRMEMRAARGVVLPSSAEGLPVVLMEALALGRPVLSTYVAGIPELVRDGIDGWLIPAGSTSELTAALRKVLDAPTERLAAMGRAGKVRVAECHNIVREAAKLAELFKRVRTSHEQKFGDFRYAGRAL